MNERKDTITAVATPPGAGGVGIIRLSGDKSRDIASAMFRSSRASFEGFTPYMLHHGTLEDGEGRVLDEVMAVYMPGPKSFTGEDVVEYHCHGGPAILQAVLEAVSHLGARLARAGEFTLRAFLNGRMDLTQAEAVAEMIHAPTRQAAQLAQVKLSGALGGRIDELRARLEGLRAQLCLAVDFPEEDIECLPTQTLVQEVETALSGLDELLRGVDRARAWREGPLVVLCGRVNAGKSSLLNALLGRNRAIVTDLPGTTRDFIEETLNLSGLHVRLTDTAGLRESEDAVELAGLEMGRELMERADLVLLVVDGSRPLDPEVRDTLSALPPERTLVALNKMDLSPASPDPAQELDGLGFTSVRISAKHGQSLDQLSGEIRSRILQKTGEPDPDEIAPNARQAATLGRARQELQALADDAQAHVPYDLLGVRLETACTALAEITGTITPQQVLDSIFESFCIGK